VREVQQATTDHTQVEEAMRINRTAFWCKLFHVWHWEMITDTPVREGVVKFGLTCSLCKEHRTEIEVEYRRRQHDMQVQKTKA